MSEKYSIPLKKLAEEFSLEEICIPGNYENILVTTPEVSRPGLAVAGFFEVFDEDRLQIIGYAEHRYLSGLPEEERSKRITDLCSEYGYSINCLSELSGITQSTVNDIVNCKSKNVGIITIKKLCEGLCITLEEFFTDPLFREFN